MNNLFLALFAISFLQPALAMLPGDGPCYKKTEAKTPTSEENLYQEFWDCIKDGHKWSAPEKIEALVAAGCNINAYYHGEVPFKCDKFGIPTRAFNGDTALTYFAKHGPARVYELLIHLKADLNVPNKKTGDTPLIIALKASHYKLCELLIASGANVHAKNNEDETALLYATNHNHFELVQLIIAHGAEINTKSKSRWTPLLLAARNRNMPICKLLLQQPQAMKERLIALLRCLKSRGLQDAQLKFLYNERDKLLRSHLEKLTINLQELLNARDEFNRRAYDYFPADWLKPLKLQPKEEIPQ